MKTKLNFWYKFAILLMINFGALALGATWTDPGTDSDWYRLGEQAPWSPPGWVFGAAWFTIGVTYSIMMAFLDTSKYRNHNGVQHWFWVSVALNILWNPIFFGWRATWLGVVILLGLSYCIFSLTDFARKNLGWKVAIFGMPYFIWLMIATSLNMYFAIMN